MRASVVVLALFGGAAAAHDVLRFGIGDGQNLPLAEFVQDRPTRGIVVDLGRAIAARLGRRAEFIVMPRRREEIFEQSGKIDVVCFSNPDWRKVPDAYRWSSPLMVVSDVLFAHPDVPRPAGLHELPYGTRVSTVLGYVYPGIEERFADGRLKREDAVRVSNVLQMVAARRTPVGIANQLSLSAFRRASKDPPLADWTFVIDRSAYHCAVPNAAAIPAGDILNAIEAIKRDGKLDAIVRKFAGAMP